MAPKRATSVHASLGERHGSEPAETGVRKWKRARTVIPSLAKHEAEEGKTTRKKAYGGDWAGGCKILLSGDYAGKRRCRAYWRKQLGWLGCKNGRKVYNRYEAVGDPTSPDNDGRRYLWVLEMGQWIRKENWLEYKDFALELGRAKKPKCSWKRFLEGRTGLKVAA